RAVQSRIQRCPQLVYLVVVEVPVPVDGRSDLPMSQHLLEHIDVSAGPPHEARVRVSQVVKTNTTETERIESSLPTSIAPPVVRIEPSTTTRPQHQRRIWVPVLLRTLSDSPLNDRPSSTN